MFGSVCFCSVCRRKLHVATVRPLAASASCDASDPTDEKHLNLNRPPLHGAVMSLLSVSAAPSYPLSGYPVRAWPAQCLVEKACEDRRETLSLSLSQSNLLTEHLCFCYYVIVIVISVVSAEPLENSNTNNCNNSIVVTEHTVISIICGWPRNNSRLIDGTQRVNGTLIAINCNSDTDTENKIKANMAIN